MRVTSKLIKAMEQTFQADKAGGLKAKYHLQLNGIGGGTWEIDIANGQCNVSPGAPPGSDVYIAMNTSTYAKLATGELDMVSAYKQQKVKVVTGNQELALKLAELFTPWASLVDGGPTPTTPSPQPAPTPTQPSTAPAPTPAPSPTPAPPAPAPDSVVSISPTSRNCQAQRQSRILR